MNMQALMKQAQDLQKNMLKAKEEIDNTVFEEEKGFVKIKMNGKKELLSIEIDKNINYEQEDIEALEDMIIITINNIINKINKLTEEKMGKFGNNIPGLF